MFSFCSCLQRPLHSVPTYLLQAGCVLLLALHCLCVWDVCGCACAHPRGPWAQRQEHPPPHTEGRAWVSSGKAPCGPAAWRQPRNAVMWNPGTPYGTFAYQQGLDKKCEWDSPTSFSPEAKKVLVSLWQLIGSKISARFRQFAKGS